MSLLKRNKDKQLAAEKKLAARHEIVKMGVDRNVRDAYFQGLVFAAVANDDQIDESERTRLRELGEALELTTEDVAEAIQCLSGMEDDAKMDVIEECARQLTNVEVAECFLKEFSELWLLGGGKEDEFGDFRLRLIDWMGAAVQNGLAAREKAAEEERIRQEVALKAEEERLAVEAAEAKINGYFDMVTGLIEEKKLDQDLKITPGLLESLRLAIIEKGYETVDVVRTCSEVRRLFFEKVKNIQDEYERRKTELASIPGGFRHCDESEFIGRMRHNSICAAWAIVLLSVISSDKNEWNTCKFVRIFDVDKGVRSDTGLGEWLPPRYFHDISRVDADKFWNALENA